MRGHCGRANTNRTEGGERALGVQRLDLNLTVVLRDYGRGRGLTPLAEGFLL